MQSQVKLDRAILNLDSVLCLPEATLASWRSLAIAADGTSVRSAAL